MEQFVKECCKLLVMLLFKGVFGSSGRSRLVIELLLR